MRALWVLARLRILDVLRSRSSAAFVFAFPILLALVVGLVFSQGHPFEHRRIVIVAPAGGDDAELAQAAGLLQSFEEVRIAHTSDPREAMGRLQSRMANAVLSRDGSGRLRLDVGARDQLFGRGLAALLPGAELSVLSVTHWGYVQFLFPGILTFSVLVAGLFGMAYTMVLYRQNLFLKKLATTPLSKSVFVAAQIGARTVLVLAQMMLLTATAWLLFDMRFTAGELLWLTAITALGLLAFMGIGFILACLIESEGLVTDVISAINLPLVFLSEIFFPLDEMPRPLMWVAGWLPTTAMVRSSREVLVYHVTEPLALLPNLALMALWAAAAFAISTALFRWHR